MKFYEKITIFFIFDYFLGGVLLNFRAYHIEYNTNISQIKPSGEKKIFLSLLLLFPQRCSKKAQNWSKGVLRARNPLSHFFWGGGDDFFIHTLHKSQCGKVSDNFDYICMTQGNG